MTNPIVKPMLSHFTASKKQIEIGGGALTVSGVGQGGAYFKCCPKAARPVGAYSRGGHLFEDIKSILFSRLVLNLTVFLIFLKNAIICYSLNLKLQELGTYTVFNSHYYRKINMHVEIMIVRIQHGQFDNSIGVRMLSN